MFTEKHKKMKTIKIFFALTIIVSATACETNMDEISASDLATLDAMETAYAAALEANNSLTTYVNNTGITNDETCFDFDRSFHHNDSIFEANHNMYSHGNQGDDHQTGSWNMGSGYQNGAGGMMGSGNIMGNNYNSNFCDSNNLNLMDSLMEAHEGYHPVN